MNLKWNYFLFHAIVKSGVEKKKNQNNYPKGDKMEYVQNMLKYEKKI